MNLVNCSTMYENHKQYGHTSHLKSTLLFRFAFYTLCGGCFGAPLGGGGGSVCLRPHYLSFSLSLVASSTKDINEMLNHVKTLF